MRSALCWGKMMARKGYASVGSTGQGGILTGVKCSCKPVHTELKIRWEKVPVQSNGDAWWPSQRAMKEMEHFLSEG